ncbi:MULTISPECIES: RNA polymerase factor sigma-54 [Alphaproteobacteria]|nr:MULTISPECIES: RNA polymerase factor sigma-54 [Alphaproteobacteria]
MRGTNAITLGQTASLRMTQVMQRAMVLLQMDNAELAGALAREAATNPCLRIELPFPAPKTGGGPPRWRPSPFSAAEGESERVAAPAAGLYGHVTTQIGLLFRTPRERTIALVFAEALEPSGWLGIEVEAIATRANCSPAEAAQVLARLQEMEPAGLFARSLSECLGLQIADQGALTEPMRRLLDHLPLLARGDMAALADQCAVSAEQLGAMVAKLRRLDPKPGVRFEASPDFRRPPDLLVERDKSDGWQVTLNRESLPKITVDPDAGQRGSHALAEARWLERTVERRNRMILEVAAFVIDVQRDFLEHGPARLQPLTNGEVAAAIGCHETTVSRIRTGLTVETPARVLPLSAFFARGGTARADGGGVPGPAIATLIAQLIATEPKDRPLTDTDITEALDARGIRISRRTVTNRRREAGFPGAADRMKERRRT